MLDEIPSGPLVKPLVVSQTTLPRERFQSVARRIAEIAPDAEILAHSHLDDGFAGIFLDMASALGMVLIEKHVVEGLIGQFYLAILVARLVGMQMASPPPEELPRRGTGEAS